MNDNKVSSLLGSSFRREAKLSAVFPLLTELARRSGCDEVEENREMIDGWGDKDQRGRAERASNSSSPVTLDLTASLGVRLASSRPLVRAEGQETDFI